MELLVSLLLLQLLRHVSAADERVLGVYIFHRHGDRSAKAWKPVNLTALGAVQVHSSGLFYRDRYVEANAPHRLRGLSSDDVVASQVSVTSPRDPVLQASALTFGQGLYPPRSEAVEKLANGSRVVAPLGGYQFLPVDPSAAKTGDRPEDSAWLQGGTGCVNAEVSSNRYLASAEYHDDYRQSLDFYHSLLPVINDTYSEKEANFKNGYSIFDLINVATIHNATIPSSSLLTPSTRARLFQLASTHEWNLAYNVSEPIRAIAGSVLAGQILDALRAIVDGKSGAPKFNAQFGAYATFMAFFGLARLPAVSPDFYGICDYASSMVFELVTEADEDKPGPDDISVRFLFANGSAADAPLNPFPLFARDSPLTPWREFASAMGQFAITDTAHWCDVCGKTDGECAEANHRSASASSDGNSSSDDNDGSRISKPVAGVIGALVTLVTIIGLLAAVMLLGGLRLVRKSSLHPDRRAGPDGAVDAKV
ncbi:hypothetical protein CP533_6570 [Ophiocordyceps camponoti-saundersi (nom. inval.)]|nr:hypothetical protein CP533_6570 [Ophiocordyceps camponoti-saundersi (nom. inval.)]